VERTVPATFTRHLGLDILQGNFLKGRKLELPKKEEKRRKEKLGVCWIFLESQLDIPPQNFLKRKPGIS